MFSSLLDYVLWRSPGEEDCKDSHPPVFLIMMEELKKVKLAPVKGSEPKPSAARNLPYFR